MSSRLMSVARNYEVLEGMPLDVLKEIMKSDFPTRVENGRVTVTRDVERGWILGIVPAGGNVLERSEDDKFVSVNPNLQDDAEMFVVDDHIRIAPSLSDKFSAPFNGHLARDPHAMNNGVDIDSLKARCAYVMRAEQVCNARFVTLDGWCVVICATKAIKANDEICVTWGTRRAFARASPAKHVEPRWQSMVGLIERIDRDRASDVADLHERVSNYVDMKLWFQ